MASSSPACRVCGCTDDRACPGGCYWVEADLCSVCVEDPIDRARRISAEDLGWEMDGED